ncbi:MAG: hypothetical protein RBT57_03700 [Paludibacter sp.]|jgi:hypothetical protein|nr:hypothetical protein [Paludibacter sp.]
MKKFIIYLCLMLHLSCQEADVNDVDATVTLPGLALEVLIHQVSIDQYEEPDPEIHAAFISNESTFSRVADTRLKIRAGQATSVDTVFTYDEIPLVRETRTQLLVYNDGTSETMIEDLTPEGINPLYTLTEMPPGDEMILSRTIIKNGKMQIFNKKNELVSEEVYPENNLKEFVDSLLRFTSSEEGMMKVKLESQFMPEGIRKNRQADGTIQLIQELTTSHPMAGSNAVALPLKAVATLNEEMTRTHSFALYRGDQLIHRKWYEYEPDKLLGNYRGTEMISENPRSVNAETLQFNAHGDPVIFRSKTYFRANQTIIKGR